MHRNFVISLVALAGLAIAGFMSGSAVAGPSPAITDLYAGPGAVEKAQYSRRYYRRQARRGYVPGAVVVTPPAVVAPGAIIVPLRPTSCGQYHYWNGVACVDARYNDPDLGPR